MDQSIKQICRIFLKRKHWCQCMCPPRSSPVRVQRPGNCKPVQQKQTVRTILVYSCFQQYSTEVQRRAWRWQALLVSWELGDQNLRNKSTYSRQRLKVFMPGWLLVETACLWYKIRSQCTSSLARCCAGSEYRNHIEQNRIYNSIPCLQLQSLYCHFYMEYRTDKVTSNACNLNWALMLEAP